MNLLYYVVIEDIPPHLLNPNFHDYSNEIVTTVLISPSGRFAGFRGAAYMDSESLAQRFLDHYRPVMDRRGYSAYPMLIKSFSASAWDIKHAAKIAPKIRALLGEESTGA